MRYLTYGLLIISAGCSSNGFDRKHARNNLTKQAEETSQSMLKEDHQKMAHFTHPTVVEQVGGRDRFIEMLTSLAATMKQKGVRFTAAKVSEPSEIIEKAGKLYAIVPSSLKLDVQGQRRSQASYLIAVSSDGGKNWKFLDGTGPRGDRSKVREILPDFPDALPLPKIEPPALEEEIP